MAQFKKGKSGNPGGKPKDPLARRVSEPARRAQAIKDFGDALMTERPEDVAPLRKLSGKGDRYTIEEVLASKPYMEGVVIRMKAGTAPHLERFMWEHVFGVPKKTVEIIKPPESPMARAIKELKPAEVRALAAAAARVIEIRKTIPAIPANVPTR